MTEERKKGVQSMYTHASAVDPASTLCSPLVDVVVASGETVWHGVLQDDIVASSKTNLKEN